MTLLEALILYGVQRGVLVGDGEDSFRDFLPEEPADCVAFHEYAGDAITPYTTHVHRSVQIKVRGASASAAKNKAVQLCRIFSDTDESRRIDFTDSAWGQAYVRQPPFKLSQDESDRVTYCFNLGITTNMLE